MVEFLNPPKLEFLNKLLPCEHSEMHQTGEDLPQVLVQVNMFNCGGIAIERCPRNDDEDCASAYDSKNSLQVQSFRFLSLRLHQTLMDSPSRLGRLLVFLVILDADVAFTITASEADKQSKNFETEFILFDVLKLQNQSSVQAFSSPIKVKRQHGNNVRFSKDQDLNSKKGELLSDLLLPSSESITFISHLRDLGIIVFDPGGIMSMIYSSALSFLSNFISIYFTVCVFVLDPGGNHHHFFSLLILLYGGDAFRLHNNLHSNINQIFLMNPQHQSEFCKWRRPLVIVVLRLHELINGIRKRTSVLALVEFLDRVDTIL
ncbi:hypothetical protein TSUD_410920 [Trifolium subterraneum]|uniref:Uncharacterized protein n=1 Tax=Trifolium subterraneum TaxID=3900 RepID=A0A2Z6P318_TRISU|nr:hypothetical protein TSUD_410920 [Trifolium subterraneum]